MCERKYHSDLKVFLNVFRLFSAVVREFLIFLEVFSKDFILLPRHLGFNGCFLQFVFLFFCCILYLFFCSIFDFFGCLLLLLLVLFLLNLFSDFPTFDFFIILTFKTQDVSYFWICLSLTYYQRVSIIGFQSIKMKTGDIWNLVLPNFCSKCVETEQNN